jgi:hypothetical protein
MPTHITHADQNVSDIIANINMIRRFSIEVARTFDDDHLATIEQALLAAAGEIARERAIELILINDFASN